MRNRFFSFSPIAESVRGTEYEGGIDKEEYKELFTMQQIRERRELSVKEKERRRIPKKKKKKKRLDVVD